MNFDKPSSLNEDSFSIPETKLNTEDSPNLDQINHHFNPKTSTLNLDEDENADENEDEKKYFILKKKVDRRNKLLFRTESTKKKRGPKKHKESKKAEHTDWDKDNVTSKIQIHYLNFIFSFLNDCAREKKIKFLNINYQEKSKASSEHLEKMKKLTILDILKNIDISTKYKYDDKNNNKINAEALIKDPDPWFKKIFEMKYLDLFKYFYNDGKPLQEMIIFNKKVTLTGKKKSFYYLLQKQKKEELKERIVYFCKKVYCLPCLYK